MNRRLSVLVASSLLAVTATAAVPDFSGEWELSAAKSKNIGMMTQMKLTVQVRQTPAALTLTNISVFNGPGRSW